MTKNADAFRTISEVAEALGLPQHVLRFWETRFPQIRPLKRAGGRRFYRPTDVQLLIAIKQLLYDQGYTIKGVQRLLKEQGVRAVQNGASDAPADLDVGGDAEEPLAADGDAGAAPDPSMAFADRPVETGAGVMASGMIDRDVLLGALDLLDECRQILAAARQ